MIRAAGILFLAPGNLALFLKRGDGGDHAGEWAFPGGKLEDGEDELQAAVRETKEEAGRDVDPASLSFLLKTRAPIGVSTQPSGGDARPGNQTAAPGLDAGPDAQEVDFTTFLSQITGPFQPVLCDENVAFEWASIDNPPTPLHPGALLALERLKMDELGVARAISEGRLSSPTKYDNLHLFAMRITGTGVAYRQSLDEFVWRDPKVYLNSEFLARCNGLPVIMEHPPNATLDAKEFADRVVGTIMLPYLKGDEVWGVAKIYDDAAARMIVDHNLSTSPSVVFRDPDVNATTTLDNGSPLLIEGKPSLLDHLAICPAGVWDKAQDNPGITINDSTGEPTMAEHEEQTEARDDADAGQKLDKFLAHMDSMKARMDAMEAEDEKRFGKAAADEEEEEKEEEKREDADEEEEDEEEEDMPGDPEPPVADSRKADRERMRADKERKDAAAERKRIADAIEDVRSKLPKEMSDEDADAMADAQAKADGVFAAHSKKAPRPMNGEDLNGYRRRLAAGLQTFSPTWAKAKLSAIKDSVSFDIAEKQIYADAMAAADAPLDLGPGQVRERITTDATGRRVSTFTGDPMAWMGDFASRRRVLKQINIALD